MGFSVSGGFAVLVVGTFIAFSMFYGATANGAERVTDAQRAAYNDRLDQQNTGIDVIEATYDTSIGLAGIDAILTVEINNTGSTVLSINDTDILVDSDHVRHDELHDEFVINESNDHITDTEVVLPGETYHIEVTKSELDLVNFPPERVKIVTEQGIADSRQVSTT